MFPLDMTPLAAAVLLMTAVLAHGDAEIIRRRVGQNVTLQTQVTGLQADDYIVWSTGPEKHVLGKYMQKNFSQAMNKILERFGGRLHLHEDGSLTITNLNMNDTAVYEVQIINGNSLPRTFSLIVEADPAPSSTTPPIKITTPPLNTGAKVGLAVGIPASLFVLVAAVMFCLYRARKCREIGRGYRGCARGRRDVCSSSVV